MYIIKSTRSIRYDGFTGYMCLGLLGGGEDTGRLAHVVRALAGPRDLRGVLGGEDADRRAIHHQGTVLDLPPPPPPPCVRVCID